MTLDQLRARLRLTVRLYRAQVKRCAQLNQGEEYVLAAKLRAYLRKVQGQLRLRALQLRLRGRVAPGVSVAPEEQAGGRVLPLQPAPRPRDE